VPPRLTLRSTNTASLHHQTYTSTAPLAHPRIRTCASTPNAISGPPASELVRLSFTRPKCSYGMSFYLLRATSKAGAYAELFPSLVRSWQNMVEDNLTTWAEGDVMFHSDRHDWSASLIHDTVQELLSVRARFMRPGSRGQASEGAARIQPRVGIFVERLCSCKRNIRHAIWKDICFRVEAGNHSQQGWRSKRAAIPSLRSLCRCRPELGCLAAPTQLLTH
jgi:hypothetical protein